MQEKVVVNSHNFSIQNQIPVGANIRSEGEQITKGKLALRRGIKMTPAAIGYLSSLGIKEVSVFKKPVIAIVTTGNELVEAGEELEYGQIYESNSKMLLSALYSLNFYDVKIHKIEDDYKTTHSKLKEVIRDNDLVIISGGISVGDYDFVGKALHELNITVHYYKVKQKTGKPIFHGTKGNTHILALQ